MDQPGKVANPARGQMNWEHKYFPVRVILRLNLVPTYGIPPSEFRGGRMRFSPAF